MNLTNWLASFVLHIDENLAVMIDQYGIWVYAILFLIVFCETGLVVTPFLPGDSLLFAAGSFAALGRLDIVTMIAVLSAAAILGDSVNYRIGSALGPRVFHYQRSRWFNPEHLNRAHAFYEKYGAKTIVLARFVPIVRTFAPFVAGVGDMAYSRFIAYNVAGGVAWVALCSGAGYTIGNIPWVRERFETMVLLIIAISVLPMLVEYVASRRRRAAEVSG